MIATAPSLLCYPPAPLNGGKLEHAPAKVGAWAWQLKIDDWRAIIHTPTRTVWNQYGQLSSFTDTDTFEAALTHLERLSFAAEWLDVGMMNNRHDMMRGCIVVFDIMDGTRPFEERRIHLRAMLPTLPLATTLLANGAVRDQVFAIDSCGFNEDGDFIGCDPLRLYDLAQKQNERIGRKFYEGLVAKRVRSYYPVTNTRPKIKLADWIKHRFDQP